MIPTSRCCYHQMIHLRCDLLHRLLQVPPICMLYKFLRVGTSIQYNRYSFCTLARTQKKSWFQNYLFYNKRKERTNLTRYSLPALRAYPPNATSDAEVVHVARSSACCAANSQPAIEALLEKRKLRLKCHCSDGESYAVLR